jgi:oxygen-independent coproporphyrinogen-3 oxidase
LIYGIPEQTVDSWYKSLKTAAMLEIKHISIYELTLEKETTLAREINSGRIYLSLENELILMYEKATEFLHSKGFIKYEISNFAKEGFECKHNIVYWRREPYLGLGPSAHSFIGKKRFHNPSNILLYSKSLSENKLSFIDDGEINCLEDLKEYIFLGLRMKEGILVDSPCLIEVFKRFEEQNLVKVSDNRITLTDKGMLVSNEIFAEVLLHIDNCPVCKQE